MAEHWRILRRDSKRQNWKWKMAVSFQVCSGMKEEKSSSFSFHNRTTWRELSWSPDVDTCSTPLAKAIKTDSTQSSSNK